MKKIRRINIRILLFLSLLLSSCSLLKSGAGSDIDFADNKVVAHRGAWKSHKLPQNSIAALNAAIEAHYAGSEFDVRVTADDSLVINHDPDYHHLPIENSTYAELTVFDLANGEELPTLREYLKAGIKNNQSTRLVCEIKPSEMGEDKDLKIAEKTIALVRELEAEAYVDYISFDYEILKYIESEEPEVTTQYLGGDKGPKELKADGIDGLDYHFSIFRKNPDWIREAKKNGLLLNAWTVNKTSDIDWLISEDFDFITTNEPELVLKRMSAGEH